MKRITVLLLSVVMLVCIAPTCFAMDCSLVLTYSKNDVAFSDLEISICRVADCDFEMQNPFDKYPVSVSDVKNQTEWSSIASTLTGFVQADNIAPYKTVKTDAEGKAEFDDIESGLYLICGVVAQKDKSIYTFYDSMLYIPQNSGEINVIPKSVQLTELEKEYSVLKLWKDNGYINRPDSVTVDILKDGKTVDTVVLDMGNNWSYSFKTSDVKSNWAVVEKNVSDGYTVTVTQKDGSFVIVNTKTDINTPSADNPHTGDSTHTELYIVLLCVSGLMIIISGIGLRRKENAAEK